MRKYAVPLRKILQFSENVSYDVWMTLWNFGSILLSFRRERAISLKIGLWKTLSRFTTLNSWFEEETKNKNKKLETVYPLRLCWSALCQIIVC